MMINIKIHLPEFVEMVNQAIKQKSADFIVIYHQAFSENEYDLFGSAVKFATMKGCNVCIICDEGAGEKMELNHNAFSLNQTQELGRTIKELCLMGKIVVVSSQTERFAICLN